LQGFDRAIVAPSTLHVFWDIFGALTPKHDVIYLDAGAYPVAAWGVERAAARGVPVHVFDHYRPAALQRRLGCASRRDRRAPVVVADGFCPGCGRPAPLDEYVAAVRPTGGTVVIDDTQALGILGARPGPGAPYGVGGGGSPRWSGTSGPGMLVVGSLAKAFGVPLAVLAGCSRAIDDFENRSETRIHTSPPSVVAIRAAEHAVIINQMHGEHLRLRLWRLVRLFRTLLARAGLAAVGGDHPVQTIVPPRGQDALGLYHRLLDRDIRGVLRRNHAGTGAHLTMVITARHQPAQLERAVAALTASPDAAHGGNG
jgi:8-amino-7-oxononanoate synthase